MASSSTIPSVDEIKKWTSNYYLENELYWDTLDFIKPSIINWFITNQRDEWIASGRSFSTMTELVFGVLNPSRSKMNKLSIALYYYNNYIDNNKSPWNVYRNAPNVSDSLAMEIKLEYPGIPMHFINVSVAFLHKSVPLKIISFAQISVQSVITFLMICNSMSIPPEIIQHILINLNIDTFNNTSGRNKFLSTGKEFTDAIDKVGDAGANITRALYYFDITQVINVFKRK